MAKTAKAASEALPEPETLTFEEALDELESLTAAMATGTTTRVRRSSASEKPKRAAWSAVRSTKTRIEDDRRGRETVSSTFRLETH